MNPSLELGRLGEKIAREFLERRGLLFVSANFRTRGGEIDLIMRKEGVVYFVEVKTRREGNRTGVGGDIGRWKWRRMQRAASVYVARSEVEDWRYLVVLVRLRADAKQAKISLLDI